jgi:demethylmenaquinone methyltransferase/2-methoxy-6-polyprenyl-1,4-benzoquinol methylase
MPKADLSKQPAQVAAMFDEVAPTYDRTNDLLSFGQSRLWRKVVARAVAAKSGQSILDLAAGTGSSTVAFAGEGIRLVAGDFSEGMLAEGRKRHPEIEFVFADATKLPFKDAEFDATTISFGIRNVVDVDVALTQMFRVTKPGGRIVICEFSKVTNPIFRPFYNFYLKKLLPWFSSLASKTPEAYSYLSESIEAWYDQQALAEKLKTAGYQNVSFRNLSFGIVAIHVGYKPSTSTSTKSSKKATN